MFANTPQPPYYAVIFTSELDEESGTHYINMAKRMVELAKEQPGFLGVESAREKIGITVSYWKDLEYIRKWKENTEHKIVRELGRKKWYKSFKTRITKVERDYGFKKE